MLEYDKPLPAGTAIARRVFGHNGNFTEGVNGYECNNSFSASAPATADTLCYPSSLAIDSVGDLFVGDFNNNRVLEYNYPLAKTGEPGSGDTTADRVYGQNNLFTTSNCNGGYAILDQCRYRCAIRSPWRSPVTTRSLSPMAQITAYSPMIP